MPSPTITGFAQQVIVGIADQAVSNNQNVVLATYSLGSCLGHCLALLLTGMGTNGATGMLDLREAGAQTIAQDEKTSLVFGMPRLSPGTFHASFPP